MPSARAVTDPHDPALRAFGRIQNAVYAEPESLIPPSMFGQMLEWSAPERQNFIVVAESEEGAVLGGTLFHLFPGVGTALSSFMGVAREAQGQGLSSLLHRERWAVLERALGREPEGLFIDVVNPNRLSAEELAHEAGVGSSPLRRRQVFAHLGFLQADVEYVQPSNPPVTNMDLLFYHPRPQTAGLRPQSAETEMQNAGVDVPPALEDGRAAPEGPSVLTRLVTDTLHAYWRPWLGEKRAARAAAELAARAGGERVRLVQPF